MIWKYFRKKLGIKDYEKDLASINEQIQVTNRSLSSCIKSLEDYGYFAPDPEYCPNKQKELFEKLEQIQKEIKAIPKEIIVRNVLSI